MERESSKECSQGSHQAAAYTCMLIVYISVFFLASSTGRFPIYFFVACLLRDSENDLLKGRLLLKHSEGIESNWT